MDIFERGQFEDCVQKIEISLIAVFLQKICQRKSFLDILDRKQSFKEQKIEGLRRAKK